MVLGSVDVILSDAPGSNLSVEWRHPERYTGDSRPTPLTFAGIYVLLYWCISVKPILWMGSALTDVRAFPKDARRKAGYQLRRVQQGQPPTDFKSLPGMAGAHEIRIHTQLEHRVIYTAKFEEAVYVLHCFQKQSRRISQRDLVLARRRFAELIRARMPRRERP